jgi:hypothetical protein
VRPPAPKEGKHVERRGPERSQSRRRVGDRACGEGVAAALSTWRGSGGCSTLGVASAREKWKESRTQERAERKESVQQLRGGEVEREVEQCKERVALYS